MTSIVTGSGRCGTHSVATFLDGQISASGNRAAARHETDSPAVIRSMLGGRYRHLRDRLAAYPHDIEVNPYLVLAPNLPALLAPGSRLVGVIRDGRDTVRSGMTNGWYWNPNGDPDHWTQLKPWFSHDRFEACCRFWSWTYRRLECWGATLFRLEDLASDEGQRRRLLGELDLRASKLRFEHCNRTSYESAGSPALELQPPYCPRPPLWSGRESDLFEAHCGELMDRHYHAWRDPTP